MVYFGSLDDYIYASNASTGALVWKYQTGGGIESSPAVANAGVYVGCDDHSLYAFSLPSVDY